MDKIMIMKTASVGKTLAQPVVVTPAIVPRGAPLGVRFCRECGHPFYPTRVDQDFCATKCRQTHHHRRSLRGVALYDFAMEWRGKRLKGGFTELCRILDDWLREERARRQAHAAIRAAFKKGPAP